MIPLMEEKGVFDNAIKAGATILATTLVLGTFTSDVGAKPGAKPKLNPTEYNLSLVRHFEGTQGGVDVVSKKSDPNVISIGIEQENITSGTVMEFWQKFYSRHPKLTEQILGKWWLLQFKDIFTKPLKEQEKWFKMYRTKSVPLLQKMYSSPEGVAIQIENANLRYKFAVRLADKYGLETEWGRAVAYNCVVHLGRTGAARMFAVLDGVDREAIDTKLIFSTYYEIKLRREFAGRKDLEELAKYKNDWFNKLSPPAQKDQLMLGRVADKIKESYTTWTRPYDRVNTILCFGASKKDGKWTHGGKLIEKVDYQILASVRSTIKDEKAFTLASIQNTGVHPIVADAKKLRQKAAQFARNDLQR